MIHSLEKQGNTPIAFAFIDRSVAELHDRFPQFGRGLDCVITVVDSSDIVGSSHKWAELLLERVPLAQRLGPFVVVPFDAIEDWDNVFGGAEFNEIYYFRPHAWSGVNPAIWRRRFITDSGDFSVGLPTEFVETLHACGAVRYASDGCGLNVVAESEDVVRAALAALT